jgi:hypothetical protein
VGLDLQGLQIAHPEVARAGTKDVSKRQRTERGVATGAAPSDGEPVAVDVAALYQIPGPVHAIVNVDDAPLAPQPVSILAAVAGAPTVIDVEHGDAAAGPVLDAEVECAGHRRRRAAVALHQERWTLAGRGGIVAVARRVKESVRCEPSFGWELDGLRIRKITRVDRNVARRAQDLYT